MAINAKVIGFNITNDKKIVIYFNKSNKLHPVVMEQTSSAINLASGFQSMEPEEAQQIIDKEVKFHEGIIDFIKGIDKIVEKQEQSKG